MYAQFFGIFLLSHNVVTKEQLLAAMEQKSLRKSHLGCLAMHAGYMNASEIEHILILQTHQDLKFGELCVQTGILTQEQVDELLAMQAPDYLSLGEALIDAGIIDNYELERLIAEYSSENEIYDLDVAEESNEKVEKLFRNHLEHSKQGEANENEVLFHMLLFNNLIRFIGDDFTPILGTTCREYPTNYCVSQEITGEVSLKLYIDMTEETCISFASRYMKEDCESFDEYIAASLEDFINLHNGLYCVNISNTQGINLNLLPPKVEEGPLLEFKKDALLMPVIFPFGTVHFIIELTQ